ncbi:hypothetical protein BMQ_pBM50032 (plasmid) [Priestia megaterium QM B1551]|uniref:Uncharacterized protein n=1 Tax=Priestia megaterium (strain ATCC 12872 / QMB1551) TaxID=545693 RepID=D5E3J6_PRIM1|nr:hypothetical protein BMQ_pBM50032 [Priestia megaterium QM B1551]
MYFIDTLILKKSISTNISKIFQKEELQNKKRKMILNY